jgi:NAD(P)H-flavin reductase
MNLYKPFRVKIDKIEDHSPGVKLFRLRKKKGKFEKNENSLVFNPGQFVLASYMGYGEAPFGVASSPFETDYMDILVNKVGTLTSAIHKLKENDEMFIRGPYGNGFPLNFIRGKEIIMITGGCGIPPMAALTNYIIRNREDFGRVYLLYGAGKPDELLLRDQLERWKEAIKVLLTVDEPDDKWQDNVGLVTDLVDEVKINYKNTVAVMCGPGPMLRGVEKVLRPLGVSDRRIFVSMERRMQCGIGKCQHCVSGDKYVCQDGPVFNFDEMEKGWD